MCSPAAAMLGVQGIGAVSSAFGASASASVQKMGLKLDATISRINADKARDNAREVTRQGYEMEMRQRLQTGALKGSQRAAMGANNVDMTTGSALNRLVSTDYMGEADAQQIRLNAARAAMGYRDQATNFEMREGISNASASGINPMLTGLTSLLGSASSIATSWYGMKNAGMFGGSNSGMTLPSTPPIKYETTDSGFRYGTLG